MQRLKTFLVVCISTLIIGEVRAQNIPAALSIQGGDIPIPAWNAGLSLYPRNTAAGPMILSSDLASNPNSDAADPSSVAAGRTGLPSLSSVENDYYTRHFGFFCKKELELEKTTRIPLRIRLGSLEQCNYLEGKR